MILPIPPPILEKDLQENLLFCGSQMQVIQLINKTVIIIYMVLEAETYILIQAYRNKRFQDTDTAFSFETGGRIIKEPIIITIKSQADPVANIQSLFNTSFKSATERIVAELGRIRTNAGAVARQRYAGNM